MTLALPYRVRPGDIVVTIGTPTEPGWIRLEANREVYWRIARGDEDLGRLDRFGIIGRRPDHPIGDVADWSSSVQS